MGQTKRLICDSAQVQDRGKGVRFSIEREGEMQPAFVIRYDGTLHAYINRCAHVSVELDWVEGEFFDLTGLYLMCSTHGATYRPQTGRCVRGPCNGHGLAPLSVEEDDGKIYLISER